MRIIPIFVFLLAGCAVFQPTKEPRLVWVDVSHLVVVCRDVRVTEAEIKQSGYRTPSSQEAQSFDRLLARCHASSLYMYVNSIGYRVTDSNWEMKKSCMASEGWQLNSIPDVDEK